MNELFGGNQGSKCEVRCPEQSPQHRAWNGSLWGSWLLPPLALKAACQLSSVTDCLEQKGKEEEEEEGRKREEEGGGNREPCEAGTYRAPIYYPTPYGKFAERCT